MNTSSTSPSRTSITAAPRPRARRPTASASASIAPCSTSSTGSPSARRSIGPSTNCRPTSTPGCSSTTIGDRIKAAGASARRRCRPSLTPSPWRRRNSWQLDHDRQTQRFRQPADRHIKSQLIQFMIVNPVVEVHLESTNRRVDVIAEGFDVAIRVRSPPLEPTELVMRQLDETIQCLVASPALIRMPLSSPSDLSGLPSLGPGPAHRDHQWQLDHRDGQTALIPYHPRLITDDIAVLREAALAGVGVAQLPTIMAWEDF